MLIFIGRILSGNRRQTFWALVSINIYIFLNGVNIVILKLVMYLVKKSYVKDSYKCFERCIKINTSGIPSYVPTSSFSLLFYESRMSPR